MPSPTRPRPVLIDTDPGMDDALALAVAFASAELDVRALTAVTGNLPSDRTVANALKVLDLLGAPDLPVAQGAAEPSAGEYPVDPFSHGSDGLAEAGLPTSARSLDPRAAAQLIVETAQESDGELVVLALGPLTNIAAALALDPELPRKVRELVIIGGAFGLTPYAWSQATGANPVSEWNVFVDPEAARTVFHAGFELIAVGLDVATHPSMNFRAPDLARLRAAGRPAADFALRVVDFVQGRGYQSYCSLIDSAAVATVVDRSLVGTLRLGCDIAVADPLTRGMTVVDRRNHHRWTELPQVEVVNTIDYDRLLDLITERLVRA